jgi:hypothetical protein
MVVRAAQEQDYVGLNTRRNAEAADAVCVPMCVGVRNSYTWVRAGEATTRNGRNCPSSVYHTILKQLYQYENPWQHLALMRCNQHVDATCHGVFKTVTRRINDRYMIASDHDINDDAEVCPHQVSCPSRP